MNSHLLRKIIVDSLRQSKAAGEDVVTGTELVTDVTVLACRSSQDAAEDIFDIDEYEAVLQGLVKEGILFETAYTTRGLMAFRQKYYYSLNPQRIPT
jgi:hypothetical protein